MPHSPQRILIIRGHIAQHHQITHGIQDFALSRPFWQLGIFYLNSMRPEPAEKAMEWDPHGILILTRSSSVPEIILKSQAPKVFVDLYLERLPGYSRVEVNEQAVGRNAADFFLRNRFEQLALVTAQRDCPYTIERRLGFSQRLAEEGLEPECLEISHHGGKPWQEEPGLDDWLERLPKPAGIYCTQDLTAVRVLENCARLGIQIPSEISLLGTDNDRVNCESVRPFISSITIPREAAGYHAARLLAQCIQTAKEQVLIEPVCEVIPPGPIEERQSTSLRMIPDPAIAKAVNYLQDHALGDGNIDQAAKLAGLNRRKLERGFQLHLGQSPGAFQQQVKLEHAKQLLTKTSLQLWEIAESCDFTQDYFIRFMKKHTGLTPRSYRKKYRVSGTYDS